MQANIEGDKQSAIKQLEEGLANGCADDITEVLVNLGDGTCDYVELIPVLEKVASKRSFYYFDDNGAGGFPHPDLNREASFEWSASKAIENINENARFEANSETARALKSNDTQLIKTTLERLKTESTCADKLLIPILEKIVRKDVYQSYSYYSGFKTEYQLGELARNIIEIILQNEQAKSTVNCFLCETLPDDQTVNTGREEYLPAAFRELTSLDSEGKFHRCPGCGSYFNWIDMPQMYGSGNCDEERLVRLTAKASRLLDKIFLFDLKDPPVPDNVGEYFKTIPLDLLVSALRTRIDKAPDIVVPFVPSLLRLLGKNTEYSIWNIEYSIWNLLRAYVSDRPERAQEILESSGKSRLADVLRHCLEVAAKKD
jgi:hypothetical protein